MYETWQALYNPEEHWRGRVKVLGFKDTNKKKDGQDLTRRYLEYLAHHPATARRIAQKLAVKFVRDQPSAGLVSRLAKVYLENDTEIVPVLRALVRSREFQRSEGMKVRDPGEDIVATYRLLGIRMDKPPRRRRRRQRGALAGRRASASGRWAGRVPTGSRSTTSRGPRRRG